MFLGLGVTAAAGAALAIQGLVPRPGNQHGENQENQRALYVTFTNPKPGAKLTAPMPFAGRFIKIAEHEPEDAVFAIKSHERGLAPGQQLPEGTIIDIAVAACRPGLDQCRLALLMEVL